MRYTSIFFDLDDTLYPNTCGLWSAIRDRMSKYMIEVMQLPPDQVPSIRRRYYETYGTTLRGLQLHHQVDVAEYLAYVHELPLNEFIQPLPGLHEMLSSLPQTRWILTNADAAHARRVLSVLEIADCFAGIIDICALDFVCKPEPGAFQAALKLAGEDSCQNCVVLDDVHSNLTVARQMGFCTVQVGTNGMSNSEADYSLNSLLELPEILPDLWEPGKYGY
jgi:putative hydrolase of the HAD superfamily